MREHFQNLGTIAFRLLLIGAASATAAACGDDPTTVQTDGTILVGARTTGVDFDVNGYLVSVNGGQGQPIGNLDTIWVTALEPGDYTVGIDGLTENCAVPDEDNPQDATVVPGDTVEVLFDITCDPAEPPDNGGNNPL